MNPVVQKICKIRGIDSDSLKRRKHYPFFCVERMNLRKNTKGVSFKLPHEIYEEFEALCRHHNKTVSWMLGMYVGSAVEAFHQALEKEMIEEIESAVIEAKSKGDGEDE